MSYRLITNRAAQMPGDYKPQNNTTDTNCCVWQTAHRLHIRIDGPAPGKPRMTQRDRWKNRPCVMRYREWCDRVRAVVGNQLPPATDVQSLSWIAYYTPAKSWSQKKKNGVMGRLHRARPDRDNIDKAVLDCLYKEDSAIAKGTIKKVWSEEASIVIEIVTLAGDDQ